PPMPPDDPAAWSLAPRPQRPHRVAYVEGTGYLDLLTAWDAENRERRGAGAGSGPKDTSPAPAAAPSSEGTPAAASPGPAAGARLAFSLGCAGGSPELTPRTFLGWVTFDGEERCAAGPTPRTAPFLITLEQALELASLNNREFQDQREDLYL